MTRCAVVTNDLQYDLVNKNELRQQAVAAFSARMEEFLDAMRDLDVPIVHLQLINREDDPNAERYGDWLPVTKGSEGARILDQFLAPTDVVMEKNKDSGFFETDLDDTLKRLGVDTVIITGMQTQICVQTTAADAFFRGFKVIVPPDGVVSAREEDQQRALDWLGSYCATILPFDELIPAIAEDRVPSFEVVPIP
ncbi:MAG TPA: isochorismatase family cysteine hydrolase [Baekduia sp.]|uniref:cysteine hydrolase family protein n=1 Tax=Baekduia sp. TaxID=2600305 RepID=UPI002C33B67D|nr:isochorismatase family cysteine hydrolase [Baekduia sp.]HMJ32531.1 isochorismatase family cysteine hydrolase [Baekduia sp.]